MALQNSLAGLTVCTKSHHRSGSCRHVSYTLNASKGDCVGGYIRELRGKEFRL